MFMRDVTAPFLPDLGSESKITEITGASEKLPLARIIPIVSKQINTILAGSQNSYVSVRLLFAHGKERRRKKKQKERRKNPLIFSKQTFSSCRKSPFMRI